MDVRGPMRQTGMAPSTAVKIHTYIRMSVFDTEQCDHEHSNLGSPERVEFSVKQQQKASLIFTARPLIKRNLVYISFWTKPKR